MHMVVHRWLFGEAVVLSKEAICENGHITDLAPLY